MQEWNNATTNTPEAFLMKAQQENMGKSLEKSILHMIEHLCAWLWTCLWTLGLGALVSGRPCGHGGLLSVFIWTPDSCVFFTGLLPGPSCDSTVH